MKYYYAQNTPSAQWTITHGLDDYPVIDTVLSDGRKIMPLEVKYTNKNVVTVVFSEARAGKAILSGGSNVYVRSTTNDWTDRGGDE